MNIKKPLFFSLFVLVSLFSSEFIRSECTIYGEIDIENNSYLNFFLQDENTKKILHENYFKMGKILLDNNCDPNKMNNKIQSPLMIALEAGNFVFVDYLINKAKITISSDISHDGKTLLHYFANKCDQYNLIQALIKLVC